MGLGQTANCDRGVNRFCVSFDAFPCNLAPESQFQESGKAKHGLKDWKFVLWVKK
jgi:hypothetical protein